MPQVVLHEADEPDVVGRLLHAHLLPGKNLTEIDFASLVADAAAARDDRRPVVKGIVQLLEASYCS